MQRKYQVAVILLNYNSSDFTLDCVDSIIKNTSSNLSFQIVVVDNNSSWQEYEKLEKLTAIRDVTVIRSRINTGFSGGNMFGTQWADAEYYYFLNNDCILLNNCLELLFRFSEQNQQVGICSGEMYNAEGKYEYNFRYFPTLKLKLLGSGLLRLFQPAHYLNKRVQLQKPTKVQLVSGSSMFIRASAFEEMGGFDTNYFLYCEEEDIALRMLKCGYFTYLVPEAKYQHFESKSSQSDAPLKLPFLKEFYISLFYYFQKNYGTSYRLAMQLFYFLKTIRKFYINKSYVTLALFIGAGANVEDSLRFKQKIGSLTNNKQ